jgi:hypothetical protein
MTQEINQRYLCQLRLEFNQKLIDNTVDQVCLVFYKRKSRKTNFIAIQPQIKARKTDAQIFKISWAQWLTSVSLATHRAKIQRIVV